MVWKTPIMDGIEYTDYEISDRGDIRSVDRYIKGVAETFIPNPDNKPQVNHINGNKLDNSVDNLEWITNRDNVIHGMSNFGHKGIKLTREQVDDIILKYETKQKNQYELATEYNISQQHISKLVNNSRRTHGF